MQSEWRNQLITEEIQMRKLIISLSTCALLAAGSVYAADAQQMDESTNPDSNKDMKTQHLQQNPNAENADHEKKANHNSKHEKRTTNSKDQTDDAASTTDTEKLRQKPEYAIENNSSIGFVLGCT